jgi:predicted dehydrogenase
LKAEGLVGEIVLCDARKEYAKKIADMHSLVFESNFEKILVSESIDAVEIVTPTDSHYDLGMKALEANKDVFIEKPLAYTVTECNKLIALSEKKARILMVGHIFRFHPAVEKLKELLSKQYFGRIFSLSIRRQAIRVPRPEMGVLHALAIHDVDLACYLFEESNPISISAFAQSFYRSYPDESTFLADSKLAKIDSSWLNPVGSKIRTLELVGSRRSAFIDFLKPDSLTIYEDYIDNNGGSPVFVGEGSRTMKTESAMPLDREVRHFVECVINRAVPLTPGEVGRDAVSIIEKALKSINLGTPQGFD